jgi:hypothetical protein
MIPFTDPLTDPFTFLVAGLVLILAVERVLRLVVDDDYPPMVWAREKFVNAVPEKWGKLVECPWCAAPYIAAGFLAWTAIDYRWMFGYGLHWTWWLFNAWLAISWIASWLSLRDVPPESRA